MPSKAAHFRSFPLRAGAQLQSRAMLDLGHRFGMLQQLPGTKETCLQRGHAVCVAPWGFANAKLKLQLCKVNFGTQSLTDLLVCQTTKRSQECWSLRYKLKLLL